MNVQIEKLREATMPFFEDSSISLATRENLLKTLKPVRNFLANAAAGDHHVVLRQKLGAMLDEFEKHAQTYDPLRNREEFLRFVRQVSNNKNCCARPKFQT